jgi:hypothetical protein
VNRSQQSNWPAGALQLPGPVLARGGLAGRLRGPYNDLLCERRRRPHARPVHQVAAGPARRARHQPEPALQRTCLHPDRVARCETRGAMQPAMLLSSSVTLAGHPPTLAPSPNSYRAQPAPYITRAEEATTGVMRPSRSVVATTGGAVAAAYSGWSGSRAKSVSRCQHCNYSRDKDLCEMAMENSKSATLSVELRAQVRQKRALTRHNLPPLFSTAQNDSRARQRYLTTVSLSSTHQPWLHERLGGKVGRHGRHPVAPSGPP